MPNRGDRQHDFYVLQYVTSFTASAALSE